MKCYMLGSAAALAMTLSACGGGGGTNVASTPPPPSPPTPTPTPTGPPPPAPVPAAQQTDFTSIGSSISIRWNEQTKNYEIMLPATEWATLIPVNGSAHYDIQAASGAQLGSVYFSGGGKYAYTGFADVYTADGQTRSILAYGIPTLPAGVPISGSASYSADLLGTGGGYSIGGTAEFDFDFAAGTLNGSMRPIANDQGGWGPYDLGRYDFQQTVYSSGSTAFSGSLSQNGAAAGSFNGVFTGPQAQELMGQWQLPFQDIYYPDETIKASGVFVGKKGP